MKRRILASLLTLALLLATFPLTASATGTAFSFEGQASYGSISDGVDFNALYGKSIYMGTYNHVSKVTGKKTSSAGSSYTEVASQYEGTARPILWHVGGEEGTDGKITVLSEFVLDIKPFHSNANANSFDYTKSDIRSWLNGSFLNGSFLPAESSALAASNVVTKMYNLDTGKFETGSFTALWGSGAAHTTDWPKTVYGDKVYLRWSDFFDDYWDAANEEHAYDMSLEDGYWGTYANLLRNFEQYAQYDGQSVSLRSLTRSPYTYSSNHTMLGNYTTSAFGVRPVTKINPDSILYLHEIKTQPLTGQLQADTDNYRVNDSDDRFFKLTVVNYNLKLSALSSGGAALANYGALSLAPGGTLPLSGTGSGHDALAYKIVEQSGGQRTSVGYGSGTATDLNIIAKDLSGAELKEGGDYYLYVWAQKTNALNSNEGSAPMCFKLTVGHGATPTASTVLVNGKAVAFDAYGINDNNYFKLRDLAYILSGTEKQFEVSWDATANAIALTSGKAYTEVGGEMASKGSGVKSPARTDSKITLDGKAIALTAYQIDGNNYFKLRDIGEAFDFGVDWDGAKNTIVIDTKQGYTGEKTLVPVEPTTPDPAEPTTPDTETPDTETPNAAEPVTMEDIYREVKQYAESLGWTVSDPEPRDWYSAGEKIPSYDVQMQKGRCSFNLQIILEETPYFFWIIDDGSGAEEDVGMMEYGIDSVKRKLAEYAG